MLLFMYADIPMVQTEKEVRLKGHQKEEVSDKESKRATVGGKSS